MAKLRDIREMVNYIASMKDAIIKGYGVALIESTVEAERRAKLNAVAQFSGRRGRKLSGRLLNAIYSGYEYGGGELPSAYIGVKGIPYGRIHEYGSKGLPGGWITAKKAKNLWVKMYGGAADKFRRMTPTDYIRAMRTDNAFKIFHSRSGNLIAFYITKLGGKPARFKLTPLFHLRPKDVDGVVIPERPYIRPAVQMAVNNLRNIAYKRIMEQLARE
jgi:hypothetical protein